MKLNKNLFLIIAVCSILIGCDGCTEASRARTIAKARSESRKKATKPKPQTIIKEEELTPVKIDDVVTPAEKKIIAKKLIKDKIPPAIGELIQVEGLVLKEVTELTINLNSSSSQIEQIFQMKQHIKNNWHYVFDPNTGKDTWRSAEATLSLKYKGKYTGDCDDYAILLASLAKQIGLSSRVVGGFNGNEGHAFAEFLVNKEMANKLSSISDYRETYDGCWVSLDWFDGYEHNVYTNDIRIIIN